MKQNRENYTGLISREEGILPDSCSRERVDYFFKMWVFFFLFFLLPPPSSLFSFKWQCTQRILFSVSTSAGFAVLLVPGKTIVSRFLFLDCFMLGLDGSKRGAATRREGWSGEAVVRSAYPRGCHWHGHNSSWSASQVAQGALWRAYYLREIHGIRERSH